MFLIIKCYGCLHLVAIHTAFAALSVDGVLSFFRCKISPLLYSTKLWQIKHLFLIKKILNWGRVPMGFLMM